MALSVEEIDMKKISIKRAFLATAVLAFGALGSVDGHQAMAFAVRLKARRPGWGGR